jgi:hypothetical protein
MIPPRKIEKKKVSVIALGNRVVRMAYIRRVLKIAAKTTEWHDLGPRVPTRQHAAGACYES